jgi:hypothetical protein
MSTTSSDHPSDASLEQLLLRDDLWLGHSQRFTGRAAIATGHTLLDEQLLHQGWPLGTLIEVCQPQMQGEWLLFAPALLQVSGLIVLLNPPALPFAQAFIQAGFDLDRVLVVKATEKDPFIGCFTELARASVGAVLAWQPAEAISYTELRKCLLSAADGTGLCVMFRPFAAQQQSSPARLRLFTRFIVDGLEVTLFKQTGYLQKQQPQPLVLELPDHWKAAPAYAALDQKTAATKETSPRRLASVTPLRGQ